MKKYILGALAALGAVGLYKLHKEGKFPTLKVRGKVVALDPESHTFQLEPAIDKNLLMTFTVLPITKFSWLANGQGGSNDAHFDDLIPDAKVNVTFARHFDNPRNVAEHVIIEAVK